MTDIYRRANKQTNKSLYIYISFTLQKRLYHSSCTSTTEAARDLLYRGSNVSLMITNELYEGSVDLSIDGSRDLSADGACGYDPVSVTHEGTCRAPPPGNQTTTTMTAAKSTTTTKIQMNKQTNKNVYCIGLSL